MEHELWPAIAGFAIAWVGEGWCFFLNGLSFVAVIVALLMMRIERKEIKASKDSPLRSFVPRIPLCDERCAGAIGPLVTQHIEPLWSAVFGVPADLRE